MQKQRLYYIDTLRGLAILLVVVGHAIQYSGLPLSNPVFEFIYSFHMPLFFFISGYVTGYAKQIITINDFLAFICGRFRLLVVPWLTWSIMVEGFFLKETYILFSLQDLVNVILFPKLWFFRYLFVIGLVWALVDMIVRKFPAWFNLCISLLIIVGGFALFLIIESDFFLFIALFFFASILSRSDWQKLFLLLQV